MQETSPSTFSDPILSGLIVGILKGPLYAKEKPQQWQNFLEKKAYLQAYLAVLNLTLFVDEAEGFAFIRSASQEDDERPRLIQRRPLGFGLSVLCVLLRKWLAERDTLTGEVRAILERSFIEAELELFLPLENSEKKRSDRVQKYIKQAIDLGLLKALDADAGVYEIMRITKAVIDVDWLGSIQDRLDQYKKYAQRHNNDGDDDDDRA